MIYTYTRHISAHSNSESRLIYREARSDDDSSVTATEKVEEPKVKKRKEDIAKEKSEAEKQRVSKLKNDVKNADYDKSLTDAAIRVIDEDNEDEIALLEEMLYRGLSQKKFKQELEKLRLKNKREELQVDTYGSRVSKVVGNLGEVKESNDGTKKQISGIRGAYNRIEASEQRMLEKLEKYKKNGEISEEQIREILKLDPSDKLFDQKLTELLGPLAKEKSLVHSIKEEKELQKKQIDIADALELELAEILSQGGSIYEFVRQRRTSIFHISQTLGIDIDKNLELSLMVPHKSGKTVKTKARITDITYGANMDGEVPDLASPNFAEEFSERGMNSVRDLKFQIEYKDANGNDVTENLSEDGLRKLANAYNATELVDSKKDLESKLKYDQFGRKLEAGQVFEYISDHSKPGSPEFSSVRIESIDKTAGEITMSEPIQIMPYMTDIDDGLTHKKKTVTFGEFLKWHKLTKAEEKMDLRQARDILKKAPKVHQKEINEIFGDDYKVAEEPIKIEKGEQLRAIGHNQPFSITDVTPEGVWLSTGAFLTLGQFVRFVNDNKVERAVDVSSRVKDVLATQAIAAEEGQSFFDNDGGGSSSGGGGRRFRIPRLARRDSAPSGDGRSEEQILAAKDVMPMSGLGFNIVSDLYKANTMLSLRNLMDMATTIGEHIDRRWKRNGKGRMARVGKKLPLIGPEFDKVAQQVENEEVNQYQEAYDDYPIPQIRDRLYATSNQDEAKACLNLLSDKGAIRMDDPQMWKTMNRLAYKYLPRKAAYLLEINPNGGKNRGGFVPEDAVKEIMDAIWGDESGKDWDTKSTSAYKSAVDGFYNDANNYEGDPKRMGGVAAELHNMLVDHMNGDPVDTGRFEGFISFIIKAGKASMTDKLYYILMGVGMKNKDGQTLLDNKTFARLTEQYQGSSMPWLEWLTRYKPAGYDGTIMPLAYIEDLAKDFGYKPNRNTKPASQRYNATKVNKYLFDTVLTHSASLSRTSRAIRNADNVDHDDTPYIIPLVNATDIEQSVITNIRGQRSAFTQDGYTNAIWGYGSYLKKLGEIVQLPEEEQIKRKSEGQQDNALLVAQVFKSFHSFEGTVTGRANYGKDYQKIDGAKMEKPPPFEGPKVKVQIDTIKSIYEKVLRAYDFSDVEIHDYLYRRETDPSKFSEHDAKMKNFKNVFEQKIMQSDGGRKMLQVLSANKDSIGWG